MCVCVHCCSKYDLMGEKGRFNFMLQKRAFASERYPRQQHVENSSLRLPNHYSNAAGGTKVHVYLPYREAI